MRQRVNHAWKEFDVQNGTDTAEMPAIVSYVPPGRYKCHRITTGANPAICIDFAVRGEVFRAVLPFAEVEEFLTAITRARYDQ